MSEILKIRLEQHKMWLLDQSKGESDESEYDNGQTADEALDEFEQWVGESSNEK